jgi:hypothetical protein
LEFNQPYMCFKAQGTWAQKPSGAPAASLSSISEFL